MTYIEKQIFETCTALFEELSNERKTELIENFKKSLETSKKEKEKKFYRSFGAFQSKKSAEEIIADLRASRRFRKKDIKL